MKLKFKHQDFQSDAVASVCDLFSGSEKITTTFSITEEHGQIGLQGEFGVGNALKIDDTAILANMHIVQERNCLDKMDDLDGHNFSIEMETGTGKTYVYTKTIFELNRRYGLTKFIIVVPSVAIREGVYKSLQITSDHFGAQYDNVPCRYFIYDSKKLSDVRQFATSNNIEIMIINIDAFKKAENIINQAQDKLNGESAMRYIQDTRPIVIIDEPQSVDNTPKSKEAIASLHPLCTLRYSATHREKHNLMYRLTPVDAYQMGLVKQIVVSSNSIENDFNKPYIALKSVSSDNGFKARIEIDVQSTGGAVTRKTITVKPGNGDLFMLSGKRDLYEGWELEGIDCNPGHELVEFSNGETLALGKALGGVDENLLKRAQIRRTIEAHLDKELRFHKDGLGIKVLSLFFIDEVAKYRTAEGERGIYAEMFEECYRELLEKPKYAPLREAFPTDVTGAHNGYFSQDKKGAFKNTNGATQADDDTYNTIMRDKEWLLSFDCPLRFIFSHSALKEGWDNPNVFQVCTLIEQKSTFTQRQKIGRGLRLCVDQDGNRIERKDINVLHVMANESFADFAAGLQKEIEQETGVKFGVLQTSMFVGQKYEEVTKVESAVTTEQAAEVVEILKSNGVICPEKGHVSSTFSDEEIDQLLKEQTTIPQAAKEVVSTIISKAFDVAESKGFESSIISVDTVSNTAYTETVVVEKEITYDEAAALMRDLKEQKLITNDGKMSQTMKKQMEQGALTSEVLGERFSAAAQRAIVQTIEKANVPIVRDGSKEVTVRLRKRLDILEQDPLFAEIWNKIKQKTSYRVQIDTETLTKNCLADFANMPPIPRARLVSSIADIDVQHAGVTHIERGMRTQDLGDSYDHLPDIVQVIATESLLKRSDVSRILRQCEREEDFVNNPQAFCEKAVEIIVRNRHNLAIDGIKYIKLAGQEYSAMELFKPEELQSNLDRAVAMTRENSLYDHIVYDSGTERKFAQDLNDDDDVKLFFKLPSEFKIETPIGWYNPDWAVLFEKNGEQRLYFVLETKGTTDVLDLRGSEQLKIKCGKAHFKALEGAEYSVEPVANWRKFKARV